MLYALHKYGEIRGITDQQESIDKIKGIIATPMPKKWYDRAANKIEATDTAEEKEKKEFNLRILADRKPYFMRYIYPELMKRYTTYVTNTNKKCLRNFCITVDELLSKDESELTDEQKSFAEYYRAKMPLGEHDCVMNKICRRVESEFDDVNFKDTSEKQFDYRFLKSGSGYSKSTFDNIEKIYKQYNARTRDFAVYSKTERIGEDEALALRNRMQIEFYEACSKICPSENQLCDILIDLCYEKNSAKQFCWDMCAHKIIENLLIKNNWTITYPVRDKYGDIEFDGERYSMEERTLNA